ncbi:PLP-dependent aminotransferase family protein [Rugamonas sp. DEMB1]|uniref:MocR-like pyridoxine biosynthesis transcription factor PdxR n=1 Tax=Rugamonas sp. DEMB1 TaxID=3039386 RepID=UPI0024476CB1|nr:PLP-dependent aminotransferase family protein [Rugamonas sp. DEMB1]WGG48424.1 PLP-dependent aminotransferase family protein [Rugamonas sp. DEMB1]
MELHIAIEGSKDLAGQLYRQLHDAIRSGRLADGQQLPPSRLLASQLGLSRKTVSDVYARLTLDRLLLGRVGVGSFVSAPAEARPRRQQAADLASAAVVARWEAIATPLRERFPHGRSRYDFRGGCTSPSHFPQDEWRRCVLHALREDGRTRGHYAPTEGLPALREAIARHAAFSRGVVCEVGQVLVTNGAQQALDLLGRVLIEPGCVVAVEEPGYPPARALFASQGARVVGVPVDAEGMLVEQIPAGARLIYVTPAHQFPLGMPMSVARRHALLARAREIGAIVVEDDYDSAFRYEGRPTDSLQSMDRHGIVAYVGTFSKVLLPELRLGYAILPPAIERAAVTVKHLNDWHSASMTQQALAKFIADGYLLKHIRRCHALYAGRRERILALFADQLAPWFELVPASAGFHITALCKAPLDMDLLLRLARRADVGLYALAGFYADSAPRQGLILGYGAIDTLDIEVALLRVRDILAEIMV